LRQLSDRRRRCGVPGIHKRIYVRRLTMTRRSSRKMEDGHMSEAQPKPPHPAPHIDLISKGPS
jgi:hypothetical protein